MKRLIIPVAVAVLSFITSTSIAQKKTLRLEINGYNNQKVLLGSYWGEKVKTIDSTYSDDLGRASFPLKDSYKSGMYRISLGAGKSMDVIIAKEDVRIYTNISAVIDSLKVLESDENKILVDFRRADLAARKKLELLSPVVDYYPKDEKFYKKTADEYLKIQKERQAMINGISQKYPDFFATRIISLQKSRIINPNLSDYEKNEFIKSHYFDELSLSDTLLFRSNAYNNLIVSYLSLYSNQRISQDELEKEFIKAVDRILTIPNMSPEVYSFVLEYLVGGFEKFRFEQVLDHIANNYSESKTCENSENKSTLQTRLDNYKLLAPGKKAPDFTVVDLSGKKVHLYDMDFEKTVVVFWATWCPHCMETIPLINELYKTDKNRDWQVVTVSLDTVRTELENTLRNLQTEWINYSDFKGWGNQIAEMYHIYATPTIYVLDRNKTILAKPVSFHAVKALIDN